MNPPTLAALPATIFHERRPKAVIGLAGRVLKRLGDGLMALFRYPAAQENDAERTPRHSMSEATR